MDNRLVHHAKVVRERLATKTRQIELAYLPPDAPESNPLEHSSRDFKTALRCAPVSSRKATLLEKGPGVREMLAAVA